MSETRGLRVYVMAGPFADATATPQAYVLTNVPGPAVPSEAEPAATLVRRHIAGKDVYHIQPEADAPADSVGYMFSGRYVTGDSRLTERVGFYGAVALHNRLETVAQYAELSR